MVNQGREAAVISIHRVAVQQVTGLFRLFPPRLQKRSSTSAAEERCLGGRPDEELTDRSRICRFFPSFWREPYNLLGILGQQQHDA